MRVKSEIKDVIKGFFFAFQKNVFCLEKEMLSNREEDESMKD
jgi:hypothetical protein